MNFKQSFGRRLRSARNERGLSQRELAELLGVSAAVVSDWEVAKSSPQLERLEQIASHLQKSPAWFFVEEDAGSRGVEVAASSPEMVDLLNSAADFCEREGQRAKLHAEAFACFQRYFEAVGSMTLASLSQEQKEALSFTTTQRLFDAGQMEPEVMEFADDGPGVVITGSDLLNTIEAHLAGSLRELRRLDAGRGGQA
ncbi:MAG: helix-turn-helix domain-containing protein [Vulcanimicrobiota bacterium]